MRLSRGALAIVPSAVVIAVALVVRSLSWLGTDVSCLITLAEKVLDGARPYVDFAEFNLPAAVLLYVPAVATSRWLGLPPEAVVTVWIFAATAVSLWLTARILTHSALLTRAALLTLAPLTLATLLILPEDVFGQREHVAVIAMLPLLATYGARLADHLVSRAYAIAAGICASLALSLKPHFALALLLPVLYSAWVHRRELRNVRKILLASENIATALMVSAYVALIILVFPEYLERMLPITIAVYAPARLPWQVLLPSPTILLAPLGVAAAAIIGVRTVLKPLPWVLILGAAGFWLAALIQGKGWPYHGYPAIALVLIALFSIMTERWPELKESAFQRVTWASSSVVLVAALYVVASAWFWPPTWYPPFVAEVTRVAPPRPRIATVCGGPELVFPLVRILHGTSVGEILLINIAGLRLNATQRLDASQRQIVERYAAAERQAFVRSVVSGAPNVFIVANGLKSWALGQPEIAGVLRKFHRVATTDVAEIWLPN